MDIHHDYGALNNLSSDLFKGDNWNIFCLFKKHNVDNNGPRCCIKRGLLYHNKLKLRHMNLYQTLYVHTSFGDHEPH